jgi:trimethylamine:corrinoid methyltransferase-like protein
MHRSMGFLSAEDIDTIFEKVLIYISEYGVRVQHASVLKILSTVGAHVDLQKEMVRFPRELIKQLLNEAPRSFTLAAADTGLDLELPCASGSFYTCTNTGARGIIDPVTGTLRDVTVDDVKKWGFLVDELSNIDMCAVPTPTDVPPETADVCGLGALLTTTRKHIWVQPHSASTLPYLFDLAIARSGGKDQLKKRPCVSFIVDSLTPFQFKAMDIEVILRASRLGVPIHACSVPVLGGTAPITPVGTVILACVEVLAILLIAQAVCQGTPVLGLATSLAMDMQTGQALKANVEAIRTNAACAQFINQVYRIPTHICGMTTDIDIIDEQAQAERCLGGLTLALSGVDIMGRAGELQAAKIISPVQLTIDDELVAWIKHLNAPFTVNTDTMVWEDLLAVEPGGHFLAQPSTLKYCRKAFRSNLFKPYVHEAGKSDDLKDVIARARQRTLDSWKTNPDPSWLKNETATELDRIVSQAEGVLAG